MNTNDFTMDNQPLDTVKEEMTNAVQHLLQKMIEKRSDSGDVTAKIDILLTKQSEVDADGVVHDYTIPVISFKVQEGMKVKYGTKGDLILKDTELVFDKETGLFVTKQIRTAQIRMDEI